MTKEKSLSKATELEQLLKVTNETLVQNFEEELREGKRKEFKTVDLWKIGKGFSSAHLSNKWLN